MSAVRRHLQHLIVLAFLAVAGLLVAPVSAQAMRTQAEAPWNEVCTTGADGSTGKSVLVHLHEHCAVCAVVGAPPPPAAAPAVPALPRADVPAVAPAAPALRPSWASARPRGPPGGA